MNAGTVAGFLLALVVLLCSGQGRAHEAGEGWKYPIECCSNRDCHRVSVDDLRENADGSWTYLPLNIKFAREKVRPSGNRWFHVCYTPTSHEPLCVFILSGS